MLANDEGSLVFAFCAVPSYTDSMKRPFLLLVFCAVLFLLPTPSHAISDILPVTSESVVAYPDYRIAVLLATFPDNPEKPSSWSKSTINAALFTNDNSMAAFYAQSSDGKVSVTGTVFDNNGSWYTIPRPSSKNETCDWDPFFADAVAAADADIDFSVFNTIFVLAPQLSCSTGGHTWSVAVPDAQGNVYRTVEVDGAFSFMPHHELGHLIGMDHANSWECEGGTLTGKNCTSVEYGDRYSVMGVGNPRMLEPAAPHKENLGWLTDAEISTVSQDGDYTISYYEDRQATAKVLKIPKKVESGGTVSEWYYLEYRRATGYDNITDMVPTAETLGVTKGALVHSGSSEGRYITTTLLDMTPGSLPGRDIFDPALPTGYSFTDTNAGVSFGILRRSDASMTIRVLFGGASLCERRSPKIAVKQKNRSVKRGETTAYEVTVTNRSTLCGKQTIEMRKTLAPNAWKVSISKKKSTAVLFAPDEKKKFIVRVMPVKTALLQTRTIRIQARLKYAQQRQTTATLKTTVRQ